MALGRNTKHPTLLGKPGICPCERIEFSFHYPSEIPHIFPKEISSCTPESNTPNIMVLEIPIPIRTTNLGGSLEKQKGRPESERTCIYIYCTGGPGQGNKIIKRNKRHKD